MEQERGEGEREWKFERGEDGQSERDGENCNTFFMKRPTVGKGI